MSKKHEIFESCLSSAFNKEQFIRFIRELLNDVEIISSNKTPFIPQNFYGYIKAYSHIANYTDSNDNRIAVFTVGLASEKTVEMARSMQRNFVKKLIEDSGCSGALVAFYTEDEPGKWRVSFIRIDYEFGQGTITEKITPAKRYSYLVGDKEPCHTAKKRLLPIFLNDDRNPTLDEIEEAFSVEPVTKEFFDLYCKKYLDLKEYLEGNADFMKEADTHKFTSEQFAKKLMGQIVFLYFIQKKGWMGVDVFETKLSESEYNKAFWKQKGRSRDLIPMLYRHDPDGIYRINAKVLTSLSDEDEEIVAKCFNGAPWGSGPKDFMRRIFDGCIANDMNFFDDYLEPLFYTGLNKNRGENSFYAPLHRRVPFLNGGLFEELDGYDWEHCYFGIPNEMFSNENEDGILDIFDRYNFTMNEDEPLEKEVAIDPEMLGKVFENLLDVKDRKSKGAFYTPREIVHYMCQESLINYLVNKTNISEQAIRDFILYGEFMRDEDTKNTIYVKEEGKSKGHYDFDYNKTLLISGEILDFTKNINRLMELDEALATVTVVDPAVGSGAFPLGMLNEIVKARNVLTDYMAIGMSGPRKFAFIATERKLYKLKTDTIKNCIFACDIEPSAVDIAKLRLWLSIVIDDKTYNNDNMVFDQSTKPRPLPNLDCNIICGNSLNDEFKGIQLITESSVLNNLSAESQVNVNQSAIDALINELITLQDKLFFTKEHEDKEDIKENIQDIYNQIILEQIKVNPETVDAYYEALDTPAQPFILWQLRFPRVFKDKGGFDICIGNPPYGAKLSKEDKALFKVKYNDVHMRTPDTYNYFISLGLRLIKAEATLSYIVPNTLLFQNEYEKTRTLLTERNTLSKVINIGEKVFEKAEVPTCIFIVKKMFCSQYEIDYADFREIENSKITWGSYGNVINSVALKETPGKVLGINKVESLILNKVAKKSILIDEIADEVAAGISTGGNEAFCVKGDFVDKNKLEKTIIKPLLVGKTVDSYKVCWDDAFIIYSTKHSDTPQYTNLYNYMLPFEEKLSKKRETKKGLIPWWSLHWPRTPELFEQPKIVMRQTSDCIRATYDDQGYYALNSLLVLTLKKDVSLSYYFVLGVLNSRLNNYVYSCLTQETGRAFAEVKPKNVRKLYVPKADGVLANDIEKLVLQLLSDDNNQEAKKKIDELLFAFYGLSDDEIKYIEGGV